MPSGVTWGPYDPSSDYLDASQYVDVSYKPTTQTIEFTALSTLAGVRDYPQKVRHLLLVLMIIGGFVAYSDIGAH